MEYLIVIIMFVLTIGIVGYLANLRKKEQLAAIQKSEDARKEMLRERKARRDLEDERAREKLRQHPNYYNRQFNPKNPDVLNPVYKTGSASNTSTTIAARNRVNETPTSQTYVNDRTRDDGNNLLNSIIVNQVITSALGNSSSYSSSGDSSYSSSYSSSDSSSSYSGD